MHDAMQVVAPYFMMSSDWALIVAMGCRLIGDDERLDTNMSIVRQTGGGVCTPNESLPTKPWGAAGR